MRLRKMKNLWYNILSATEKYCSGSQEVPQVEYVLGLAGDYRTVRRLRSQVNQALAPKEEIQTRGGKVAGICYLVMSLTSPVPKELFRELIGFDRKTMGTDRDLYPREKTGMNGLQDYFERKVAGEVVKARKRKAKQSKPF
ncbi:MAG: hypothetical protein JSW08_01345 [archaeon]|nr:MAG: hypothetical protein JSW08_01345 [archaeon]